MSQSRPFLFAIVAVVAASLTTTVQAQYGHYETRTSSYREPAPQRYEPRHTKPPYQPKTQYKPNQNYSVPAHKIGWNVNTQLVINSVKRGSVASEAGARIGDRIVAVDGIQVKNYDHAKRLVIHSGKQFVVTVWSHGRGYHDLEIDLVRWSQPTYQPAPRWEPPKSNPTYTRKPAYKPEPRYIPKPVYAPKPTYTAKPKYPELPGYEKKTNYKPEPKYIRTSTYSKPPVHTPSHYSKPAHLRGWSQRSAY